MVLKMACPTSQILIQKAQIIEEFRGFLREGVQTHRRHLLINLQDRLSWQESARCHAVEHLQSCAEFTQGLVVVSLTKQSSFYHQSGKYVQGSSYAEFAASAYAQFTSEENSGWFIPVQTKEEGLVSWYRSAFDFIHQMFFASKEILTRQERMDFIGIFYLLLMLKLIEIFEPTSISFTCKDGVS